MLPTAKEMKMFVSSKMATSECSSYGDGDVIKSIRKAAVHELYMWLIIIIYYGKLLLIANIFYIFQQL